MRELASPGSESEKIYIYGIVLHHPKDKAVQLTHRDALRNVRTGPRG